MYQVTACADDSRKNTRGASSSNSSPDPAGAQSRAALPGNIAYAATKGAALGSTRTLTHELLREKIRVNCITPGLIDSDMADNARRVTPEDCWQSLVAEHPLGIGAPEDVAEAIRYLLSDQTKHG